MPYGLVVDERSVTGQHHDLFDVRAQRVHAGADGVASAARFCLEREVGLVREHLANLLGGRRVDDQRLFAGRLTSGVDHVGQHRAAADRVEHLRQPRLHARAETGRQDDGLGFGLG